jgi:hypothetical protein
VPHEVDVAGFDAHLEIMVPTGGRFVAQHRHLTAPVA